VNFKFGKNWERFLSILSEDRIRAAEKSLREMFQLENFQGKSFLDIGSGSGLFSLAARRMGARVFSFDVDPDSVGCAIELKRRFFPEDRDWRIEKGSALDQEFLKSLGRFDLVYSWGVLHHTGAMWQALKNAVLPLNPGGRLFIAIYNDQGRRSRYWTWIKKTYNRVSSPMRGLILFVCLLRLWGPTVIKDACLLRPFQTWRSYNSPRGMSPWVDLVDWVGGYPFETATPESIIAFYQSQGLQLIQAKTCGQGLGCNEFVFSNRDGDEISFPLKTGILQK
jgi:SAM-dependent methyltransferase